ncbi:MAG: DUF1257 domain-containing protein [Nitrospirota bacterium]
MSHFTRMKTKLVKKEYLIQALTGLGYQPKEGTVKIKGYNGQETDVEVMVPTKNHGYDLGFKKTGDVYELVADWYGIKDINPEKFLNQLQQKYAYHTVLNNMNEQGFEVVEEENQEDKTIHLTVRRTVF